MNVSDLASMLAGTPFLQSVASVLTDLPDQDEALRALLPDGADHGETIGELQGLPLRLVVAANAMRIAAEQQLNDDPAAKAVHGKSLAEIHHLVLQALACFDLAQVLVLVAEEFASIGDAVVIGPRGTVQRQELNHHAFLATVGDLGALRYKFGLEQLDDDAGSDMPLVPFFDASELEQFSHGPADPMGRVPFGAGVEFLALLASVEVVVHPSGRGERSEVLDMRALQSGVRGLHALDPDAGLLTDGCGLADSSEPQDEHRDSDGSDGDTLDSRDDTTEK